MNNLSTSVPRNGHTMRRVITNHLRTMGVVLLSALLVAPPPAEAGKPVRTTILQPPFVPPVNPQPVLPPLSPFNIIGFIQSATLDPLCTAHPFCGGTVTVNGITVTIPQNTILQFPAAAMTWDDLFTNAPAVYAANRQSGLAMTDSPTPLATHEIKIAGNRIVNATGDQYIAGLVFVSQQSVNTGQGFINYINYATGDIWVSQKLTASPTGARLRLNTPTGVFGNPDPNADPRFTADEENPTYRASTGYPMCVPRADPNVANDATCPQWNRPRDPMTGAFSTSFTMPGATSGVAGADGITHQIGFPNTAIRPDPFEQAPLEVGDYITFSGTLTQDPTCSGQPNRPCQYISAHTIDANVAIFTAPGTWPVYVALGPFALSVAGTPNPLFPLEGVEKVAAEVFTTDSTQLIDLYAVDVNPCTGSETHRFYGAMDPFGPPVGGVKGLARFVSVIGNYLPPTREMRAASRSFTRGGPIDTVLPFARKIANGLVAGVYRAPNFDFAFGPALVLGAPLLPLTFEAFPFLVNGSGPYARFSDGVVFPPPATAGGAGGLGQLKPWPGANSLSTACSTGQMLIQPPISNAGTPQTVPSEATVTLNASLSADMNTPQLPLAFTWLQSGGPAVSLVSPSRAITSFSAPALPTGSNPVVLTFQMVACNGYTCGGVAQVHITVIPVVISPAPALTTITPNTGVQGTNVPVTIAGTNLTGATLNLPAGISASAAPVVTATQLTATLVIAANATAGVRSIGVTTGGGPANALAFTVTAPAPAAPALTTITPNTGVQGTNVPVTIAGTNLTGATLNLPAGISASAAPVVTATQLTATLVIAANATAGVRSIGVTTGGGPANALAFTVTAPGAAPAIASVAPNPVSRANPGIITLTGTNFAGANANDVQFQLNGVTQNVFKVGFTASPTQIAFRLFFVTGTAAAAGWTISVTGAGGTSNAIPFSLNP